MKWITFSILWFTCHVSLIAADYETRFQELKKENSPKIEQLLNEWREKQPDDPDAWINSANYYFDRASDINTSTKRPDKDDYALTNEKTGEVVGSLAFTTDPRFTKIAIGYLEEAAKRFPQRLDVWCGLSYSLQEAGDFDRQFSVIKECVAYAKERPDTLRWLKGQPLSTPAESFVPEKLHGYSTYYMKKGTSVDDERFLKIVQFIGDSYPKHCYAFNDLAAYYSSKHDRTKVREYLEKAHVADPSDVIVLLNLGDSCVNSHDLKSARLYYQKVLDLKPEAEDLAAAKRALQELDKNEK